jgi:hypothetical protein
MPADSIEAIERGLNYTAFLETGKPAGQNKPVMAGTVYPVFVWLLNHPSVACGPPLASSSTLDPRLASRDRTRFGPRDDRHGMGIALIRALRRLGRARNIRSLHCGCIARRVGLGLIGRRFPVALYRLGGFVSHSKLIAGRGFQ